MSASKQGESTNSFLRKKIYAYLRISVVKNEKKDTSIVGQMTILSQWMSSERREIDKFFIEDPGTSGSGDAEDRPKFREMLEQVKPGVTIICTDDERLSRGIEYGSVFRLIYDAGGNCCFENDRTFDYTTADQKLVAHLKSSVAQRTSDASREKTRKSMRARMEKDREEGKEAVAFGRPPFGCGRAKIFGFSENPEIAAVLKGECLVIIKIWTLVKYGLSLPRIVSWCADYGYQHRKTKWNITLIRSIVEGRKLQTRTFEEIIAAINLGYEEADLVRREVEEKLRESKEPPVIVREPSPQSPVQKLPEQFQGLSFLNPPQPKPLIPLISLTQTKKKEE